MAVSTNPTSSVSTDPTWVINYDENMDVLAKLMDYHICQANLIHLKANITAYI